MITNQAVTSDFNHGKASYTSYQLDEEGFNALQAMMTSAIPNPPEKPILIQYPLLFFSFFNFKKERDIDNAKLQAGLKKYGN